MRRPRSREIMLVLLACVLLPAMLTAQRGNISVPLGASVSVPYGAEICADTIFANGAGHGSLNLADPSCICSGIVITPVELLTFSATLKDGMVLLTWSTETESRNFGFEPQRNTGSQGWTRIGFVEGHGSSTAPHSYRFTDRLEDLPHFTPVIRYRLRQIDFDGRSELSPEVEIRFDRSLPRFELEGYPSPCDENYTLCLTMSEAASTNIRLHDVTGRLVMPIAQNAIFPAGSHIIRIHTVDVPSGLYLLVVDNEDHRRTEKVTIRH